MSQSDELFARASRLMPGGVNSPVRAFKAVGGTDPYPQDTFGSIYLGTNRQPTLDYTPAGVLQTIQSINVTEGGMQYQTLKPPIVQFNYPAGWVGTPSS